MGSKEARMEAAKQRVLAQLSGGARFSIFDFSHPERRAMAELEKEGMVEFVDGAWQETSKAAAKAYRPAHVDPTPTIAPGTLRRGEDGELSDTVACVGCLRVVPRKETVEDLDERGPVCNRCFNDGPYEGCGTGPDSYPRNGGV